MPSFILRSGRAAAVLIAMLVAASCSTSVTSVRTEFVIHVDSVTGPTAVSGGVAFESRLWGTVGGNGCYSFKEVRAARTAAQVDVTVIGQYGITQDACPPQTVTLNGVILRVTPVIPNPFAIVIHQPDGTMLVRQILSQ